MAIDTSIRIRLIDGFSAGLRTLGAGIASTSRSFGNMERSAQFAGNLQQSAGAMGQFAAQTRNAVEVPTRAFMGFEQAMSRVAALSGEVGTTAFGQLQAQAEELGAATSFSATEAAVAMGNFAQAGMRANQIMDVVPSTLSLARAAGAGLDQTSEILGSTLNSLGIETADASMAADVLTRTFSSSNTTLASLGDAFKVAAPLAAQTGTSIQSLAAMVAVLGNNAIQGSEAGTGLRTVMAALASPAGAGATALAELGYEGERLAHLQQLVASGRMPEALSEIGNSLGALTNDQKLMKLMDIFGREGVTAASILVDASLDDGERGIGAYIRNLESAGGTAARVARVMEDNLGGEFERLSGAADGLAITIGRELAPGLREAAISLQGTVEGIAGWVRAHPSLTAGIGGTVAGITGLTLVLQAGTIALSTLVTTWTIGTRVALALNTAYRAVVWYGNLAATGITTRFIPALMSTRLAAALAASPLGTAAVRLRALGATAATMLGPMGLAVAAVAALAAVAMNVKSPEGQTMFEWWDDAGVLGGLEQVVDGFKHLMGEDPAPRSEADIRAGVARRWEEEQARRRAAAAGSTPVPGSTPATSTPTPPPSAAAPVPVPGAVAAAAASATGEAHTQRTRRSGGSADSQAIASNTQALQRMTSAIEALARAMRSAPTGTEPLGGGA